MRAMHLYEDTSPPYPEVFRASAYVNEKMERKRMIRLWSDRAGTVGKRSWGGGGNPRGRGERAKQHEGLAPRLGLGEGWSAVRMSSGKTKGRPG